MTIFKKKVGMKIAPTCKKALDKETRYFGHPYNPERHTINKKKLQKAIDIEPKKNIKFIFLLGFLRNVNSPTGIDVTGIKNTEKVKI
jgi:hypothetical protein